MELTRLLLGLLVAVLLPLSLEVLRQRPLAAWAFTTSYATYAILPVLSGGKGLILWLAVTATAAAWPKPASRSGRRTTTLRLTRDHARGRILDQLGRVRASQNVLVPAAVLVLALGMFYGTHSVRIASTLWRDDRLSVILSGFLLAVFAGNLVIAKIVNPYFEALNERDRHSGLLHLGAHLGWIERALVFAFITAGQPEAAALAITVKSLARLPEVQGHEGPGFGQYVIVGTMSSLLVAVGAGIVVRIALGLPAL